MIEIVIFLGVFVALSLIGTAIYGKRIRAATEHYGQAREVVSDIIISFNRQFEGQEKMLTESIHEVSDLSRKYDENTRRLEDHGHQFEELKKNRKPHPEIQRTIKRVDVIEDKVKQISALRTEIMQEIAKMKKQHRSVERQDLKIESAIPIGRERALSPLTPTELVVLQLLASEGEKTAPRVREQIQLSREHTARLMKKLYEKGYVERRAGKMPFMYSLKEEMRKILSRTEQSS